MGFERSFERNYGLYLTLVFYIPFSAFVLAIYTLAKKQYKAAGLLLLVLSIGLTPVYVFFVHAIFSGGAWDILALFLYLIFITFILKKTPAGFPPKLVMCPECYRVFHFYSPSIRLLESLRSIFRCPFCESVVYSCRGLRGYIVMKDEKDYFEFGDGTRITKTSLAEDLAKKIGSRFVRIEKKDWNEVVDEIYAWKTL
ncbi:MAG: hypothetical protein QW540_07715 [Archaeoglobaceae archaeon]